MTNTDTGSLGRWFREGVTMTDTRPTATVTDTGKSLRQLHTAYMEWYDTQWCVDPDSVDGDRALRERELRQFLESRPELFRTRLRGSGVLVWNLAPRGAFPQPHVHPCPYCQCTGKRT